MPDCVGRIEHCCLQFSCRRMWCWEEVCCLSVCTVHQVCYFLSAAWYYFTLFLVGWHCCSLTTVRTGAIHKRRKCSIKRHLRLLRLRSTGGRWSKYWVWNTSGMILAGEKQCMWRKTCQNVAFSTTYLTRSNPSLCGERLAANSTCMYGTLFLVRQ
jgi:hypothetical protein